MSPPPPIREKISSCPDFLRTKTKRLIFTSPIKGLMGSTSPGPRNPPSVASPRSHGNLGGRNSLSVRFSRNENQMDYYGVQYGLQQNSGPKIPPCDRGPTLSSL